MNKREIRRAIKEARKEMEKALQAGNITEYIRIENELDFLEYKLMSR